MKRSRILAAGIGCIASAGFVMAQSDVTVPGDLVEVVSGQNDGDANAGPPPAAENVENAINDIGQKYLNFLDLNSGLIVTPALNSAGGGTILSALRLYTANDAAERDPASYVLEGASSAAGPWTTISSGGLNLPLGRNPGGNTPLPPATSFNQLVEFDNSSGYLAYRLIFPTLRDAAAANSMQIAEIEFIGVPVPEPSSLALLLLGGCAALGRRNRA